MKAVREVETKLVSFVQAFQQNLNQLYLNQKHVADMGYTNNVHVHVLRGIIQERLEISDEEYKEKIDLENAAREAIQKQQEEAAAKQRDELKEKQAAEAAATMANGEQPAPAGEEEPIIFGGDAGEENRDGEEHDQGAEVDEMPEVPHGDGAGDEGKDEGERGEEGLPL